MHLHGHTFQIITPDGSLGAQQRHRDRVALAKASIVLGADNPGIWMLHCHNTYHQKAGITTSLNYSG